VEAFLLPRRLSHQSRVVRHAGLGKHCVKIELDEMREHETKRDEIEAAEITRLPVDYAMPVPVFHFVKDDGLVHLPIHPDAMVRTIVVAGGLS
jgi:hypothetical protein